jgi:hypothetical protein
LIVSIYIQVFGLQTNKHIKLHNIAMLLTKILVSLQILHFYVAPTHSGFLPKHLVKRADEMLGECVHSTLQGEQEARGNPACMSIVSLNMFSLEFVPTDRCAMFSIPVEC